MRPEDCRTLEDLARFPFTTKADLRETYPFGMFAVPMSEVRRIHASSGTTGRPTVVGYTENDLSMWADVVARSIRAAGGRPGHKVHVAYGYGLFTGGLGAHYGAERAGCTVIPVSGGMTARQVQLIQDFEPEIIMVTPSYMLTLLDEFERQGVDPRGTSLRIGIFGAEPWTEEMRARDRGAARHPRRRHLRAVRGDRPGRRAGVRGDQGRSAHLGGPLLPRDRRPGHRRGPAGGEEGELVFTSLTKEAMPVIRYRTRDLTRLLPGTARPAFRRMEKVTRPLRRHDHPARGERLPQPDRGDRAAHARRRPALPAAAEQARADGPHDRTGRGPARHRARGARGGRSGDHQGVKDGVGLTVDVEIVDPETLERSVGKIRRVKDLREA